MVRVRKGKRRVPPRVQKAIPLKDWLRMVEVLIARHSTPPRKRGPNKGHGETDSLRWVAQLARLCQLYIQRRNRGHRYDGNMALARLLGLVLCAWYAQVHRAKGFDPNRPLARRAVFTQLAEFRARLLGAVTDERLMGVVWGRRQAWNYPFGRGAKGGTFV